MKKILFMAFAIAGAANALAWTESFDTGPTGFIGGGVITWGNTAGGDAMAFSSGTWHARNVSAGGVGTTGWFNNNGVFAPNSGAGQLNANFNNSTGSNNIDNYMMSPVQTFAAGDKISFWTRTVSSVAFPDRLILKLSTNGASVNTADFTQTLLTINPTLTTTGYPTVYTQFTVTLTSGGTGRFAFNYNVTGGGPSGANSDFIGIDDVAYTAVPEPATMAALGLGVAALLRRRRK